MLLEILSLFLAVLATAEPESSEVLRLEPAASQLAFFTGQSFFVTCLQRAGSGATRLAWSLPSGKDITTTRGRVHVEPSQDDVFGIELVVEEALLKDQGRYTCSAVLDGREVAIHVHIRVYQALTFWETPSEQTGVAGKDFVLTCHVRADPHPRVSWYVNQTAILDNDRLQAVDDGLLIRNLSVGDAGTYTCAAFAVTPLKAQVQDKDIRLHVHYKPQFVSSPYERSSLYGVLGQRANLTCEATAEPDPEFVWFKGRQLLGNDRVYRIHNSRYKSTLQVHIKDHRYLGEFLCLVENRIGEIQKKMFLLEGTLPSPPQFSLWSNESGVLSLQIRAAPRDTLPPTGYRVQWTPVGDAWANAREYLTGAGTDDFLIQNLDLDAEYDVRVATVNVLGSSPFAQPRRQRTAGLPPADADVGGSGLLSASTLNAAPAEPRRLPVPVFLAVATSLAAAAVLTAGLVS